MVLQRDPGGKICAVPDLGDYYDHVWTGHSGNDHENHSCSSPLCAVGEWNCSGTAAGLCAAQGVRSAAGYEFAGGRGLEGTGCSGGRYPSLPLFCVKSKKQRLYACTWMGAATCPE